MRASRQRRGPGEGHCEYVEAWCNSREEKSQRHKEKKRLSSPERMLSISLGMS